MFGNIETMTCENCDLSCSLCLGPTVADCVFIEFIAT